ncbi:MAG: hypothetical protein M0C28_22540 [Candidatus Moduliflexus flocculans]|nr:hypothetical protein [Candidatus Moduliflexus flocculans]
MSDWSQKDACPLLQDGQEHGQAGLIRAHGDPPGHAECCPAHQGLDLHHKGPAPLNGCHDGAAGNLSSQAVDKDGRRVFHLWKAAGLHLEYADLAAGAEAVLHGAHDPVCTRYRRPQR